MTRLLDKPPKNSSTPILSTKVIIAELRTFIVGIGKIVTNAMVMGFNSILQRLQL